MSSSTDTLQFRFPNVGDSILSKINALRKEHRFCDVTLLLGVSQGTTIPPLHFHGHRVVLSASSDFLRDQFLLHKGQAELSLGVVSSVEVGKRLLLSCYTGLLEVPLKELVSYLTAASALQMNQVVEKCAQAISRYLSPTLAFLKVERTPKEKEIQQSNSLKNQKEKDAAQPSTSIQDASPKEGEAVGFQSVSRVSQGGKMNTQGLREVKDDGDRMVLTAKIELSENPTYCLEGGEMQSVHTNKPSYQDNHSTDTLKSKLHPPAAIRDDIPLPARRIPSEHEESVDSSQNQDEVAGGEQREGEEMFLMAAHLQECGELTNSNLSSGACLHKSQFSVDELKEDTEGTMVQRPYLCRRCDRVFQQLESYVGHLKEHRQYLCLVCGKGFPQRSNLTCHIRVHSGFKPFRCPLCHKTFSQRAMLQDHLNLHTGNKPHECNFCAVHFAQKPGLRRHLKDINGKGSLKGTLDCLKRRDF